MSVKWKLIWFQTLTAGGVNTTQDITSTGFGTPQLAIFLQARNPSQNAANAHAWLCLGATDGTRQFIMGMSSEDAQAAADQYRFFNDARVAQTMFNASIDDSISFNSWITDGVRVTYSDTSNSTSRWIACILINGLDGAYVGLANTGSVNTATDITALGFEPNMILAAAVYGTTANVAGTNHLQESRGIITKNVAGTISQTAIGTYATDEAADEAITRRIVDDRGLVFIDATGAVVSETEFSSFDSSGFSITPRVASTATRIGFIAMKFPSGYNVFNAVVDTPTGTGNTDYNTPGISPKALFFYTSSLESVDAANTDTNSSGVGMGSVDNDNNDATFIHWALDGAATSDTDSYSQNDSLCIYDSSKVQRPKATNTFGSGKYTLNFSAVTTNAKKWLIGGYGEVTIFTGTGDQTATKATQTGSGTFTNPTLTGSGSQTATKATQTGSGTYTTPTFTGSSGQSATKATQSGSGTHTAPVFSGTGDQTASKATQTGSGTHTAPTFSGSGSQTATKATQTGSGSFGAPTFSGSGDQSATKATQSGSGTHTVPVFTGSGNQSATKVTQTGSGSYGIPTFSGSGSHTTSKATQTGTGKIVFIGSGNQTASEATQTGSGSFISVTRIGSGDQTANEATQTGSGTFTAPVFSGSGSHTASKSTQTGTGKIIFSGTGNQTTSEATQTGSGTFSIPTKTGSGNHTANKATQTGSGAVQVPVFSGSGNFTVSKAVQTSSAVFTSPSFSGTGSHIANKATQTGSGAYVTPLITGTGSHSAKKATQTGSGAHVDFSSSSGRTRKMSMMLISEELRKSQEVTDIVISFTLVTTDGSQVIGISPSNLFSKIIGPDGQAVLGYDEATFSEPNGNGDYIAVFSKDAVNKAFTLTNQDNPYMVTVDSISLIVEPVSKPIRIVSTFPWELPTAVQIREEMDSNSSIADIKAKTNLIGVAIV